MFVPGAFFAGRRCVSGVSNLSGGGFKNYRTGDGVSRRRNVPSAKTGGGQPFTHTISDGRSPNAGPRRLWMKILASRTRTHQGESTGIAISAIRGWGGGGGGVELIALVGRD